MNNIKTIDVQSDHAKLMDKFRQREQFADDDLNRFTGWGMAHTTQDKSNSFTSIGKTRNIPILLLDTGTVLQIAELIHDSNKIYSCIQSFPKGQIIDTWLENIGFNFQIAPPVENCPESVNFVSSFLGAGWVHNGHEAGGLPDENTSVLLAVGDPQNEQWKLVTYKLSFFGVPPEEIKAEHLLSAVKKLGMKGKYLLPVLNPKRVVMGNGIIFVG